ncbi:MULTISPECIES: nucleotidyltransferase family protein [unclassified Lentimicrobium]|uniref:nucleotidyltransferase family protein n=1 Tax=unclassified Lentimicrobium TaxID=2677434 RepID=UPI001556EA78|nr:MULTISPECIES: nucleotidyltransferase family protein [unclassified Lentimicrobium]NPD44424.1 nucleotidyltransferase family protein [Lentimicrobium sp. S6]NPD84310.1 nucleotidyltransferase family protein [Lentimicrobium sp. L6]
MKAFIFAAGLGTRLYPYTKSTPKALVPLQGRPMLGHLILKLKSFGMTDIIINIHHYGEQIISYLKENKNFGCNIIISNEREELLDTGGGLKKALNLLENEEDLLVHNVDILTDFDLNKLINHHQNSNSKVTLLVQNRRTSRYLLFDEHNKLKGWTNIKTRKTKPENIKVENYKPFAFNGVHVINKSTLPYFNVDNAFPIIPVYIQMSQSEEISALEIDESFWMDLGKPEAIDKANKWLSS